MLTCHGDKLAGNRPKMFVFLSIYGIKLAEIVTATLVSTNFLKKLTTKRNLSVKGKPAAMQGRKTEGPLWTAWLPQG